MLADERHRRILEIAQRDGRVITTEVAEELGVSPITARRDISALCDSNRLVRVHGGALLTAIASGVESGPALTGLVVPTSDYYYSQVVRGAEGIAAALGTRLVLGVTHYDSASERDRVARLIELGIRGILISTSQGDAFGSEVGPWLDRLTVPVVLLERAFSFPDTAREYDHVRTDHAYGAAIAVRHLASLGHRSIALALHHDSATSYWLERGFHRAASGLGLDSDAPSVVLGELDTDRQAVDDALNGLLDACIDSGTRAAFVHADAHASRLVELASARGIRVPDDLAIVAYDDEVAALSVVPLTAVGPPKRALGALGMRLLDERVKSPLDAQNAVRHVSLLPSLIRRESCGAKAAAHL